MLLCLLLHFLQECPRQVGPGDPPILSHNSDCRRWNSVGQEERCKHYLWWILLFTFKILVNPPTVSPYKSNIISEDMGRKLSKDLKAAFYHECSALTREGVDRLFHDAIDLVVSKKKGKKKKVQESCIVLWFEYTFSKYVSRLCFRVVTSHDCNKSWQIDILIIALHAKYFYRPVCF